MNQVKNLGNSDLAITQLGVGAWAMGGSGWAFAWGEQDDRDSLGAIHAALDAAERDGVSPCTSPIEVGRSVEVVLAVPYDFGQVEQSVFGPSGVLDGLRQPSPLVMMRWPARS